jgi:serine/threonine-protein kinase
MSTSKDDTALPSAPTVPSTGAMPMTVSCPVCGAPKVTETCGACGWQRADRRLGVVLEGKYRIDALLGAGGMGRVYRATHVELGEPIAVKFLLAHWAKAPELRARFRREAVALARLRHPNIVSVLDFGEHGDELYMVMELVKGVALGDVLGVNEAPLPFQRVAAIIDQVLQVLEAAHGQGVIHRDLKPDNVMLLDAGDRVDRIKVLDFGLAYVEGDAGARLTQTGVAHGTPHYMSPEQCRGTEVGPPTDVYAVGVMLYEALTGRIPFDGTDAASIMAQQMFVEPPPMETVGYKRAVPAGFAEVVRQALRKRPDDRPTASELRDLLGQASRGTDAASIAQNAAAIRTRAAALSRNERAFTGVQADEPHVETKATGKRAALLLDDGPRAKVVRDALAVAGVTATIVARTGDPAAVDVVVVPHDEVERVAAKKGVPGPRIVALDVPSVARLTELVRLGVSDAVLADDADDVISRKVLRILSRGR